MSFLGPGHQAPGLGESNRSGHAWCTGTDGHALTCSKEPQQAWGCRGDDAAVLISGLAGLSESRLPGLCHEKCGCQRPSSPRAAHRPVLGALESKAAPFSSLSNRFCLEQHRSSLQVPSRNKLCFPALHSPLVGKRQPPQVEAPQNHTFPVLAEQEGGGDLLRRRHSPAAGSEVLWVVVTSAFITPQAGSAGSRA